MDRYVAFLRGINLGKNRRVKNPALIAEFERIGCEDVATFRASGNVVFGADGTEAALQKRVEKGLGEGLGYEVVVFLRSVAEVAEIAARTPFPARAVKAAKGKLQVAMLPREPAARGRKDALGQASDEDRLAVEGRELYWLPSGGISESELDLKAVEKAVGPWTMRTMGTIEQIAAKYCGA
jgi:uncharacterized protein (DUF1697 family)